MSDKSTRILILLRKLVALNPRKEENLETLKLKANDLEKELEKNWSALNQDDFHEAQHYIMACDDPKNNEGWKESLDDRIKEIIYKLMKRKVEPDGGEE